MRKTRHSQQLGFEALLQDADQTNHARTVERETGHLPTTMAEALPFFRELLADHHAAMLAGQVDEVRHYREEAHRLAVKLNGGRAGILAHEDSPGTILARETAAAAGTVPLWGQQASFTVTAAGARARIEMDGVFGLFVVHGFWPGFSAHAVEWGQPFISETGYRSFLGVCAAPMAGMTPETFAAEILSEHVRRELKGRLVPIAQHHRQQAA